MSYYSYSYNISNRNIQQLTVSGDYISGTVKPVYDNLGRTSSKTIDFDVNSADAFYNKLTYDYVTKNGFESGLVSQVTSEVRKSTSSSVISTTTYSYTYDANGNITLITNGSGVIQYKYAYDDLGQLTREDNRAKGYSYVYTYDNAGNITSKKRYAFTTGTLGDVQQTYSYSYNDSTWSDLLTSYNGDDITYVNFKKLISQLTKTPPFCVVYRLVGGVVSFANWLYNRDGRAGISVFSIISFLRSKFFFVSYSLFITNLWGDALNFLRLVL